MAHLKVRCFQDFFFHTKQHGLLLFVDVKQAFYSAVRELVGPTTAREEDLQKFLGEMPVSI
eukprot:2493262-Karenia_brevis.AAC.1